MNCGCLGAKLPLTRQIYALRGGFWLSCKSGDHTAQYLLMTIIWSVLLMV
jgi:hypothetical protein